MIRTSRLAARRLAAHRTAVRPMLESLEDRQLLATFTVTNNTVDSATTVNTLRWAIAQANLATTPSNIELELGTVPATVTLTGGPLDLSNTKADHDLQRHGGRTGRDRRGP